MTQGVQKAKGEKKKGSKKNGKKALEVTNYPLLYTQGSTKGKGKDKAKPKISQEPVVDAIKQEGIDVYLEPFEAEVNEPKPVENEPIEPKEIVAHLEPVVTFEPIINPGEFLTTDEITPQEAVFSPVSKEEGEYEVQVYQVQLNGGMFYNIDEALTKATVSFQGGLKRRERKGPPLYVNVQSGKQSTVGNFWSRAEYSEINGEKGWVDKTKNEAFSVDGDLATLISEGKVKVLIDG